MNTKSVVFYFIFYKQTGLPCLTLISCLLLFFLVGCGHPGPSKYLYDIENLSNKSICTISQVEPYFKRYGDELYTGTYLTRNLEQVTGIAHRINRDIFLDKNFKGTFPCVYHVDRIFRYDSSLPFIAERFDIKVSGKPGLKTQLCFSIRSVALGLELDPNFDRQLLDSAEAAQAQKLKVELEKPSVASPRPKQPNAYKGETICVEDAAWQKTDGIR